MSDAAASIAAMCIIAAVCFIPVALTAYWIIARLMRQHHQQRLEMESYMTTARPRHAAPDDTQEIPCVR